MAVGLELREGGQVDEVLEDKANVTKRNVARPGGNYAFEKLLAALPMNDRKEEHAAARAVAHLVGHWKVLEIRGRLEQIAAREGPDRR